MSASGARLWRLLAPGRPGWWALVVMAAAALGVIALRPTVPDGRRRPQSDALLITAGIGDDAARRLIDSLHPAAVYLTPDAGIDPEALPSAGLVRSPHQILERRPGLSTIDVAGWGLERDVVTDDRIAIRFHPAPLPSGIRPVVPAYVTYGEAVRIAGWATDTTASGALRLADVSGRIDSSVTGPDGRFSLDYLPPAAGSVVVRVTSATEPAGAVGIVVEQPPPGSVLILESSPTFDGAAVRRWLAEGGAAVTHRVRVSRDRFRTEFLNTAERPLNRLRRSQLAAFDLIVLDGGTLDALQADEHEALRRSVIDDGVGVLVWVDRAAPGPVGFWAAGARGTGDAEQRDVRPTWRDGDASPVPLPASPLALPARFAAEALVDDGTGRHLATVERRGAGRLGWLVRLDASRWQRHGESAAFARLWQAILSRVARRPGIEPWQATTPFPTVDRPVRLEGPRQDPGSVVLVASPTGTRDTVHLTEAAGISVGRFWPRQEGWHRIEDGEGTGRLFYVYPTSAWPVVTAERRRDATARHVLRQTAASPEVAGPPRRRPVPLVWAFAVLVACLTLLWLAEDRSRDRAGAGDRG